ncbi:conserved hypothetical protein, partial [Trichinella spiralis]|uniref:hypothetical protein n=1 Tax=Trichinella spiralis TaxID=6334 RepID=UPI0001EFE9A0
IAVFRRVELGSVDEPSRSARKDDRARDSAFDLPLGTTVVARVFVHFERAVATYSVSGVREPEDVREGDRHRRDPLTYWPDERTSGLFIPERQITVASLTLTLVLRAGSIENQQPTDSGYHGVLCEITEQETRGPQRSAEPTVGRTG